jgi:hypothetical protein
MKILSSFCFRLNKISYRYPFPWKMPIHIL